MILTAPRLKYVICLTVICFTLTTVFSQVRTTVLSEHNNMEDFVPLYGYKDKEVQVPVVNVLPVDLEEAREQDRRNKIGLNRYGLRTDVNYSKKHGSLNLLGNLAIWELKFKFSTPSQARFLIENLNLPDEARLYVYSEDSRMVIGPVTRQRINRNKFHSDIIKGRQVHVKVILLANQYDNFNLQINGIVHGPMSLETRDFGDALFFCHNDVICSVGNDWRTEIKSVCRIITNIGNGTGVLVNNSCEDFTPYVLSAFHNADVDIQNGSLSSIEIEDAEDWSYRFKYDSPTCSPATEPTTWLTFQGSTFRSGYSGSDFILMELDDPILGNEGLAVSGWDRSDGTHDDLVSIHHPAGDVKKITFDGGTAIIETSPPSLSGGHGSEELFTVTFTEGYNGDSGEVQDGSSGGPWFNQDNQIVGQLLGGTGTDCDNPSNPDDKWIGRFHISWDGDNSDATRLSNWMGPNTTPMTIDSRDVPFIDGPDHLCSPDTDFILENSISGRTVSWSASPAIRFTSSTSGSGQLAELTGSSVYRGEATITFTISGASGCDDIVVEKKIWVGTPLSDLSITGVAPYGAVDAVFTGSGEDRDNDYKWYVDGVLAKTTSIENAYQIPGGGCGNHLLTVKVENACGTTTSSGFPGHYYNISCFQSTNDSKRAVAFPNPGHDQVQITLQINNVNQEYHHDEWAQTKLSH